MWSRLKWFGHRTLSKADAALTPVSDQVADGIKSSSGSEAIEKILSGDYPSIQLFNQFLIKIDLDEYRIYNDPGKGLEAFLTYLQNPNNKMDFTSRVRKYILPNTRKPEKVKVLEEMLRAVESPDFDIPGLIEAVKDAAAIRLTEKAKVDAKERAETLDTATDMAAGAAAIVLLDAILSKD